jgi:hypothetical protein
VRSSGRFEKGEFFEAVFQVKIFNFRVAVRSWFCQQSIRERQRGDRTERERESHRERQRETVCVTERGWEKT